MDSIYWYAMPAFMALMVKVWLVVNSDKRKLVLKNWPLAMFFLSISIFNIIEVTTYLTDFAPVFYSSFIKLYNGAILLSLCFLLIISGKLAENKLFSNNQYSQYYALFGVFLFIIIANSNLFVAGYESFGYGFIRIPGKYFTAGLLFACFNLLLAFYFLLKGNFSKKTTQVNQRRCKAILISYLPFMASLIVLMLMMLVKFPPKWLMKPQLKKLFRLLPP